VSRAVFLKLSEGSVVARCVAEKVDISCVEALPEGGTRLVCMSVAGAERIRRKLKASLLKGEVARERFGPGWPL
jgi:hypothetical protein